MAGEQHVGQLGQSDRAGHQEKTPHHRVNLVEPNSQTKHGLAASGLGHRGTLYACPPDPIGDAPFRDSARRSDATRAIAATPCMGRRIGVMSLSGVSELGPFARPVELPEDVDDRAITKASGLIELPMHVRWSGPPKTYDLDDRRDRARVYEQVLREGTAEDVRFYIDVDHLLELWDDLVLPSYVRRAWADWFRRKRHIELVR